MYVFAVKGGGGGTRLIDFVEASQRLAKEKPLSWDVYTENQLICRKICGLRHSLNARMLEVESVCVGRVGGGESEEGEGLENNISSRTIKTCDFHKTIWTLI